MEDLSPKPGLSTRFAPTEKPRQIIESSQVHPTKLASQIGFNPVATMNLGQTKVYVRPVKNTQPRAVSPNVVAANGAVLVHGQRQVNLTDNLHTQVKNRTDQTINKLLKPNQPVSSTQKYIGPEDVKITQPVTGTGTVAAIKAQPAPFKAAPSQMPTNQAKTAKVAANLQSEQLKKQLEQINKVLFDQIKQKIAVEIARQQGSQPANSVQTKPTETNSANKPVNKPILDKEAKETPKQGPFDLKKDTEQLKAKLEPKEIKVDTPETWKQKLQPEKQSIQNQQLVPSKTEFQTHTVKLEDEVKILVKEVENLDKTVTSLETEKNNTELATIERRVEIDQKMLAAIADWRLALNNLINSHSIAIKYLKEKVDKLDNQASHNLLHETKHKQTTFPTLTEPKLPDLTVNRDVNLPKLQNKPVDTIEALVTQVMQPQEAPTPASISLGPQAPANGPQPKLNIQANLITKEVKESEIDKNQPKLVIQREVQAPTFEAVSKMVKESLEKNKPVIEAKPDVTAVKTLVDQEVSEKIKQTPVPEAKVDETKLTASINAALEKQRQQVGSEAKVDETAVRSIVTEILKEQLPQVQKQTNPEIIAAPPDLSLVKDVVKDVLKNELPKTSGSNQTPGTTNTVYVKEVDKATVIPENAQTGVVVKEQAGAGVAPVINISTADIEKQILEQAEKEEAVKEAVRQAKEKAQQKIQEEKAAKEKQIAEASKKAANDQLKIVEPSQEMIQEEVNKLKTSLTTIDNKQLANLSKEQRTEMIRKLENLEKETVITKQYDEIKATAERRRINSELSAMLHQMGQKLPEVAATPQGTTQKIETLKTEEKKQTTPAQKAQVIAEIKELQRLAEARKAAERSRPTVKAQPAYGKMLPNTPTIPNVINGIVKDTKGLLLSTVVIIVKDSKGDPVRAFKTNKIGQFALSTPVPNGVYTLELEKEGFEFDIIEVDVNGAIMQPIEIKAR